MDPNIHRRIYKSNQWHGRNTYEPSQYFSINFYEVNRPQQRFQTHFINDVPKGTKDDERMGRTIYQKEVRIRIMLRNWDCSLSFNRLSIFQSLGFQGITDGQYRTVRNYTANINQSAMTVAPASLDGTLDGLNEVVDASVFVGTIGEHMITCQGNQGRISITDTHPNEEPAFSGTIQSTPDPNSVWPRNFTFGKNNPCYYRIVVLKYFDLTLNQNTDHTTWFDSDVGVEPDVFGPYAYDTDGLGTRIYHPAVTTIPLHTSMFCSLNENTYRKTVVMYDKVVKFFPGEDPTFVMDEIFKLNETVTWQNDDDYPLENGLVIITYDLPYSVNWAYDGNCPYTVNTPLNGIYGPNITYENIHAEVYYTQPKNK